MIIKPSVARKLLHLGYQIIDLKPKKTENTTDFTRCVFLFAEKTGIDEAIKNLTEK